MIRADEWFAEALRRGYGFVTGVPCSFLTPFINYAISNDATRYVGATSEDGWIVEASAASSVTR